MWDLFAKTVSTLLGKTNVYQPGPSSCQKLKAYCHLIRSASAHAHMSISGGSGE